MDRRKILATMTKLKRWKVMDNVFIVSLLLMVFFAIMDVKQINTFFFINTQEIWDLYYQYTGPAFWSTWYVVFLAIGIIWYLAFKDKSEAVALTLSLWILEFFGTQDLFYFLFSPQTLTTGMCWADILTPVRIISDFMGECCPSGTSFMLSGVLGIFLAYNVYKKLQVAKW